MQKRTSSIPLEIQLRVVCQTRLWQAYDLLVSLLPTMEEWNPKTGSAELFRERAKEHLNFVANELIEYLKAHPEICTDLLNDSYDKRYAPSTFIEKWKANQYRVGWVKSAGSPSIDQIRVFSNFTEATADYVLFSWGLPRLTKEQADWYEMNYY